MFTIHVYYRTKKTVQIIACIDSLQDFQETENNCTNFIDTGISTQADDETEYEGEGLTPSGPPPTDTEKKMDQDKKIVKKKKKKKK